jgi:peptidoglycan/LPS O-acetylase OafA/YrhL
MPMMEKMRFRELEGLRAYLALMVVIGHCVEFTTLAARAGPLRAVLDPGYYVQTFMILSGFVITHLLLSKDETYGIYILRRVMRLLPIFVVCLTAGYLSYGMLQRGVSLLPWAEQVDFAPFVTKWQFRAAEVAAHPFAHAFAHVTMLHGAVPAEWLPEASRTILAPGWSISLEWQFYLVAPFILWLFGRSWGWPFVFAGMVAALAVVKSRLLGTYDAAFLGVSSLYLVLGMVSRLALPALVKIQPAPLPVAAAAATAVLILSKSPLDLLPWTLVYPYLVDSVRNKARPVYAFLLANRVTLAVGRASYSIYLIHYVVLSIVVFAAATLIPGLSQTALLAVLLAAIPVIVAISLVLFAVVERPGIALGHLWARHLVDDREKPVKCRAV